MKPKEGMGSLEIFAAAKRINRITPARRRPPEPVRLKLKTGRVGGEGHEDTIKTPRRKPDKNAAAVKAGPVKDPHGRGRPACPVSGRREDGVTQMCHICRRDLRRGPPRPRSGAEGRAAPCRGPWEGKVCPPGADLRLKARRPCLGCELLRRSW